jgi:ribosome-associated toxin RatA of RatAB toxin-antitoxin module
MQTVTKSVLVPYSAAAMFELVDRVEHYPEFLPWCGGASILGTRPGGKTARIDIDYHGVRAHFTTDNQNTPPTRSSSR